MEGSAEEFFKQLFEIPENKKCIDCGQISPQWASVNNGIFVCLNCAGAHRAFGVNVSFIRSIGMDSWTETQIQLMNYGGNKRFTDFMTYYKLATEAPDQKYHSQAAIYYRNRLKALTEKAEFTEPPTYEQGRVILVDDMQKEKDIVTESEDNNSGKKDVFSIMKVGIMGFMTKTADLSKKAGQEIKDSGFYDSMKKAGGQIKQGSLIAAEQVSKGTKYAAKQVVIGSKVAAAKVKEKTDEIASNPKVQSFTTNTKSKFNEAGGIIKSKYNKIVNKEEKEEEIKEALEEERKGEEIKVEEDELKVNEETAGEAKSEIVLMAEKEEPEEIKEPEHIAFEDTQDS